MARRKKHKDVEFLVSSAGPALDEVVYDTFAAAAEFALSHAIATGSADLDVLVYSEAGARWYGGDDAVDEYLEDPEASVFERFEIKVNAMGRVP
jgi:hypothetical protein